MFRFASRSDVWAKYPNDNCFNRLDRKNKSVMDRQKLLSRSHDYIVHDAIRLANTELRKKYGRKTINRKTI
jgi:hypothetical protein